MKSKIILGLALVCLMPLSAMAQETTNSYRRVSIAEVNTIRLEVEQIGTGSEVQFRVRDYAAHNYGKKEVFCDLYYISDKGTDEKESFARVTLKQVAPDSDNYSGSFTSGTDDLELAHGVKFRIVYKSDGVALPISTWYACYYH